MNKKSLKQNAQAINLIIQDVNTWIHSILLVLFHIYAWLLQFISSKRIWPTEHISADNKWKSISKFVFKYSYSNWKMKHIAKRMALFLIMYRMVITSVAKKTERINSVIRFLFAECSCHFNEQNKKKSKLFG